MLTNCQSPLTGDGVLFVERTGELHLACKVKPKKGGAVAKASLNRANKYVGVDPKPGDLPMSREIGRASCRERV